MTTDTLSPGRAMARRPQPLAGHAGPVTVVVLALVILWYLAAAWMNAPFARQIAPDPAAMSTGDLLAATMTLERPLLPAPHQVVAELYQTVLATPVTSRRSLVYHAWVTLASTLLGFAIGAAVGDFSAQVGAKSAANRCERREIPGFRRV